MVCGAYDIIFILDLSLCLFVLLDLCFYFFRAWFCCFWGVSFIMSDLVYCIDWNIITLSGRSVVMTFLFDWTSLLFIGFVFIVSFFVILYSNDLCHAA